MLYGAIIGDIAGSVWEFVSMKSRPAELIMPESFYTDDTVMTIAVADALMNDKDIAKTMREYAPKYHFGRCGYGINFSRWLQDPQMGAYNSCGNGSAMRVSAVAWMFDSIADVLDYAKATAEVSHNHPEGIKGAQAVAGAIYLARTGHTKSEIREFVEHFGYDLSRTCDQIRPGYTFIETCQGSVPEAITAFLDSTSFEDCIGLAISIGGDADTIGAIAGSIAEAFYGVPEYLIEQARAKLDAGLAAVVDEFEREVA